MNHNIYDDNKYTHYTCIIVKDKIKYLIKTLLIILLAIIVFNDNSSYAAVLSTQTHNVELYEGSELTHSGGAVSSYENSDSNVVAVYWNTHNGEVTITARKAGTAVVKIYNEVDAGGHAAGVIEHIYNVTVKSKHTHSWSYTYDANSHWQVCSCGATQNSGSHSYTSSVTTAATCTTAGVRTYTCSVCGRQYTESIPALNHNFTGSYSWYSNSQHRRKCSRCDTYEYVNHTLTSSYTSDGSSGHYRKCTVCSGRAESDSSHSYSSSITTQPTCTSTGVRTYTCTASGCGYSYTETVSALGHDYSSDWTTDSNNHWHKCSRCTSTSGNGAHVDSDKNGLCDTCGYRMYYIISVPSAVTGLVYNGQPKTGVPTGTGYTITGNTATNAGNYTATCSLQSGYRWTGAETGNKTVSWSIAQANGYINLSATSGRVRYGTASTSFTISSHHGGSLSVSDNHATATCALSGSTVTISSLGGISAGANESVCPVITVTVTSAATTNYYAASATYTLKIVDDVAPTGSISVNNTRTMKNNKKAVGSRNISLAITYSDAGSSVYQMAVFENDKLGTNQNATLNNISSLWENPSTSKSFSITTTGDGEKIIYLLLKDSWGNTSVIPIR